MARLSTDLRSAVLHPRENIFRTAALTSAAADTAILVDGTSSFMFRLSGTFVGTLLVEGSINGADFETIPMRPINVASKLYVLSATAAGTFVGTNPGYSQLRVKCSAYTSGSAAFTISASNAVLDQVTEALVASLSVTATGTAAASVTLTLPSPGAGLRQYITNLRIESHATALLVMGATPVIVTSTNLPGARAFSFPVDARAGGTVYEKVVILPHPVAASAQATATTIVCPATTSIIWRVTVDYYVAP